MIIIEGEWKSQINDSLSGKLSIIINVNNLNTDMTGIVKFTHSTDHQCINTSQEFIVEIKYERQSEFIFNGQQTIIDRLFIRQRNFGSDFYYTMQMTSYNGAPWQGSYTCIYPNDLGQLSDLQIIMSCDIAQEFNDTKVIDKSYKKKRKLLPN